MKRLSWVLASFVLVGRLSAQTPPQLDGRFGLEYRFDEISSTTERIALSAASSLLDLAFDSSVNSDKRYGADIANFKKSKSLFDVYFLMDEGYTTLHSDTLSLTLGRSRQRELFDSPYSLFLNSAGHSANGMVFGYSDSFFQFESRWIELNNRSDFGSDLRTPPSWAVTGSGFPDRGANLKTIVFKLGTTRVGIQDAAIYTGRSFDLEYFVNPVPEYFTQYFKTTAGRPWTTSGNENNLIGFFWDRKEPEFSVGAQVLIDDFSLHFLLPAQVPNNPWKAAWTIGGDLQTEWGRVGLYHAGALKYTFEPITATQGAEAVSAYGYTLFPSVEYYAGSGFRSLSIEDNALGYGHGENNLAVMLTWSDTLSEGFHASSNLELVLAGANSPTNPWQDATRSNEVGTHWIDDSILERTLTWSTDLRWEIGDWQWYCITKLGFSGNVLKLSNPVGDLASASSLDHDEQIWKPSSSNQGILELAVGVLWHWDISRAFWPAAYGDQS